MKRRIGFLLRTGSRTVISGACLLLLAAQPALPFFHDNPDVELGQRVYESVCSACHGTRLQGNPDWQSANPDGTYPAPPHDETGHTWHHGNAMLLDYIRRGGQAVLGDMGVEFKSGMPAFEGQLSEAEIGAVLDYIKSTWPERIRAVQAQRTAVEAQE
ncbi:MAG TPA: cytochrome c [Albidovulum sp.]|uniref:c-type cytochrome n=1 Tax=Albidovulum sp. TaxID=1872424 RepID=UPI002C6A2779|nr:cytochrome c [Albidovulum sp.]